MTTTEKVPCQRASGEVDPWDLVTAAQNGNAEAFGALYESYVDTVFRFILFRVGDRPLAEDLTSETFLRALRRISSVSYQGRDVGAWFVTIARNLVYDHCKSSSYRLDQLIPDFGVIEQEISQFRRGGDTGTGIIDRDTNRLIHRTLIRAMSELTPAQREVVALRFFQGLTVEDTCVVLRRNSGQVKSLQHRAVRALDTIAGHVLRELRNDA